MADCTGYGFSSKINLCLSTPLTAGNNVADLTITIEDVNPGSIHYQNFDEAKSVVVSDWDGSNITVDVTPLLDSNSYSFVGAPCDLEAQLTLTSQGGRRCEVLLEFVFDNCSSSTSPAHAQVYENCGGAGPHIVSEMQTVYFSSTTCP